VQQHRSNLASGSSRQSTPAEFSGSSRREVSPFSKTYLHSLPIEDYALPNPKTVVLEKLNRQRAQNSPDSANYTLADITPVVTDLLLTRHLTSDDFFRTRSEAQLRSALIQRRSSQDISGPSLPSGSTTAGLFTTIDLFYRSTEVIVERISMRKLREVQRLKFGVGNYLHRFNICGLT
jgi:hypothetical protein